MQTNFTFLFFVGLQIEAGGSIGGYDVGVESKLIERGSPNGVTQEVIQFDGEVKWMYGWQYAEEVSKFILHRLWGGDHAHCGKDALEEADNAVPNLIACCVFLT